MLPKLPMRPILPLLALSLLLSTSPRAGILGDDSNQEESDDYISLPLLRLSVDGGFSQWIISDDTSLTSADKAYYDDQQQGQDISADAIVYFLPRGGIGLTWIWFLSRTQADNLVPYKDNLAHDLKERVSIIYIGPSFWTRLRAGRYGLAHVGFGAGYLGVLDTWTDNGMPNKVEAKTFALVTSLGWDYSIFRWVGIGISGRFVFSNIAEFTYNGEKIKAEDPENLYWWYNLPLYRLELNAGLRFFL